MKIALAFFFAITLFASAENSWPGAKSSFHGFDQFDFNVEELECKIVIPKVAAKGKPWIWRARFFGHEPQTDVALLEKGFHVGYCDVAGLYGAPAAVARWDRFYDYLIKIHQFSMKPALEGMSRGGLIIYNWAAKNPDKVSCIYADAPVCDFKSWPGIKPEILKAYDLTAEQARTYQGCPVDNLAPLAKAKVPLLHVVGMADDVVPVAENTDVVEARYQKLGGSIEVIRKEGVGHHPHSLKDPKAIVAFVLKNTR